MSDKKYVVPEGKLAEQARAAEQGASGPAQIEPRATPESVNGATWPKYWSRLRDPSHGNPPPAQSPAGFTREGYVRLDDVLHTLDMITQPNKTIWQAGFNCALQEIRNSLAEQTPEPEVPDAVKDLLVSPHGSFICESQLEDCRKDCERQNARTIEAYNRGKSGK